MATEVMDLLLKVGVTEEVTSAFQSISNLAERIKHQVEQIHGSFRNVHTAVTKISVAMGATGYRRPGVP
jgi:hypothetical protein